MLDSLDSEFQAKFLSSAGSDTRKRLSKKSPQHPIKKGRPTTTEELPLRASLATWGVLQSLISPSKGNEKKKKLIQHVVFVAGHSSRCERRRTGLNFVERTRRDAVLVV